MSQPAISIIVPTFNESPETLKASLESVARQSFADFECLLIDESTDLASKEFAAGFCASDPRFRHILPPDRLGLAGSLNLGIHQARAPIIARFDSDDICVPNRLELQIAALDNDPELTVLGGGLEIIDDQGKTLAFRAYPQSHDKIAKAMQFTTPIAHPTAAMRKSAVVIAGSYDAGFRYAEDIDLWLRILNLGGRFGNLPETLVRYRQNSVLRSRDHWRFNLRARRKNCSQPYMVRRLLGLMIVGVWSRLPAWFQQASFRGLLLRAKP